MIGLLPKVSVVVPVYKVEKYINRCVDSILNQTYSNLEVILVNDGSPDECGKIINSYEQKDSRVIALHKANGGLSDARNFGMHYVTGEFTVFVDSDDWLDPYMIQRMIDTSLHYGADVVQSTFYYAYEDYLLYDNRYISIEEPHITIENNKDLMNELVINEKVKDFAWGKLYKTALIRDLPFRKGVLFEDVFWTYNVMHRVKTYVILAQPLYYYYQRSDSIVATYTARNLDIIKGLKERHSFIEANYPELKNKSYKVILETSIIHYNLLFAKKSIDKDGSLRKEIQNYIEENYHCLKNSVKNVNHLEKQLDFFRIHPYVNFGYLFLSKVLRKLKVIPQKNGLVRINI